MAKKTFMFMMASVLAIVMFLGMASALTFTDSVSEITLNQNDLTQGFILSTDYNATYATPLQHTITDSYNHVVTLTFTQISTQSNSVKYNVTASGDVEAFNFPESAYVNVQFNATNQSNSAVASKTVKFIFEDTNYCGTCANEGKLKIDIEDIQVISGFGDDDSYWYLFDEIEVELQIENTGNSDIDKIEVEWELYTTSGKKIMDGSEDDFNLKDGDDQTVTFTFVLDEDIDDFEGEDAVLYVRAKGEIDDSDSQFDGNETCDSESREVSMRTSEDFVITSDFEINGVEVENLYDEVLSCGDEVTITGKVWNIGDSDQDDVLLEIYNKALGIVEKIEFDEVESYDSEGFSFTFVIDEVEEKTHYITFEVYDEDEDLYENSEDDKSVETLAIKIDNCAISEPLISATLNSEAKSGQEMIMTVTITNLDNEQVTFAVNADGFTEWAELKSISPGLVVLEAGASQEVQFVFDLDRKSAGDHTFKIFASAEGEVVQSQSVLVTVEKGAFSFDGLFDEFNWKLGLIILINLILVIAIIVVAVRIKRR